jgi:hypothetical protein
MNSRMAAILGRPRTINVNDCSTKPPTNCDMPKDPSRAVPGVPGISDPPTSYSSSHSITAIGHKMHEMLSLGRQATHKGLQYSQDDSYGSGSVAGWPTSSFTARSPTQVLGRNLSKLADPTSANIDCGELFSHGFA